MREPKRGVPSPVLVETCEPVVQCRSDFFRAFHGGHVGAVLDDHQLTLWHELGHLAMTRQRTPEIFATAQNHCWATKASKHGRGISSFEQGVDLRGEDIGSLAIDHLDYGIDKRFVRKARGMDDFWNPLACHGAHALRLRHIQQRESVGALAFARFTRGAGAIAAVQDSETFYPLGHAAQNFECDAGPHGMPRDSETLRRILKNNLRHLFQRVTGAIVRNFDSSNFRKAARLVLPYRFIADQAGKKQ